MSVLNLSRVFATAITASGSNLPVPSGAPTYGYTGKIQISGANFNNGSTTIQPRGSSFSGYEDSAILGIQAPDASGGTNNFDQANGPNLTTVATWKFNTVRIPVNEASWLGYTCYDANGAAHTTAAGNLNGNAASGATYQSQIIAEVAALNAIGCNVIIDLHFTCAGRIAPVGQESMANQDNSIQFWTSVASVFGYPNGTNANRSVMFELFNEPYISSWSLLMNGGFAANQYINYSASGAAGGYQFVYPYQISAQTGTFIANEAFTTTSPSGISGKIMAPPYTNTTTGLSGSGLTYIYLRNSTSGTAGFTGQGTIAVGTVITGTTSGATATIASTTYGFHIAGHAQMVAAIRATGAINVCMASGLTYNSDLSAFAANYPATMDTTAPAGFVAPANWPGGTTWVPQTCATWHPYAQVNTVSAVAIATGGGGYAVNDTITFPLPLTGTYANTCWGVPAVLTVTSVSGGVVTGVSITNAGKYGPVGVQTTGMPQASTSGAGTGATFNLTMNQATASWASVAHFPNVIALQTTPGIPVCVTEVGDYWNQAESGLTGAPYFTTMMNSLCDPYNIGMIPWSYNPPYANHTNGSGQFYIIDSADQPTLGFGATVFSTFVAHAP